MSQVETHELVAKLPKLGPLIGWTRRENGTIQARLWAKADDNHSDRAVLALTVTSRRGKMETRNAAYWRVLPVALPESKPPAVQRFALADVLLPSEPDEVIRMVFLHLRRLNGPGPYAQGLYQYTDELRQVYGSADSVSNPGARIAQYDVPKPEPVGYTDFAGSGKSEQVFLEELFTELGQQIRGAVHSRSLAIPLSYSRLDRHLTALAQCEVRPCIPEKLPLRFAATCCRHPGVELDRDLADRSLAALAARAEEDKDLDFVFMLGDQIYADATAGVLDVEDPIEKYTARYDAAFGSRGFRALTSRVPVYMVADDHEVRDGWPNDALPSKNWKWNLPVNWAWEQYFAHQRWHGPDQHGLMYAASKPGDPDILWYRFDGLQFHNVKVPFFAFDARFQRRPWGQEIVKPGQMEAFERWLDEVVAAEAKNPLQACIPKFVVSGSVIAPGLEEFVLNPERERRADNWQGFARNRAQIARLIARSGAQNVVLLSGDYHCGAVASLRFYDGDKKTKGYAIVAPPLYAPFTFANVTTREIMESELIRDPENNERVATCEARACAARGFVAIEVEHVGHARCAADWKIKAKFYQDDWDGSASTEPVAAELAEYTLCDGQLEEPDETAAGTGQPASSALALEHGQQMPHRFRGDQGEGRQAE